MIIQSRHESNGTVLALNGRLDATWADYVGNAIDAAIHQGEHRIDLDMSQVPYISSAGISLLLKYRRKLASVGGRLVIQNPNENVLSIFQLMRLTNILLDTPNSASPQSTPSATNTATQDPNDNLFVDKQGIQFAIDTLNEGAVLHCTRIGDPNHLENPSTQPNAITPVRVDHNSLCLGLGALQDQSHTDDSSRQLGEVLGLCGTCIEQPPSPTAAPDFLIAHEQLIPELLLDYGLFGQGQYSHLVRFEAGRSERRSIRLSELAAQGLEQLQCDSAAFAIIAEADSVVGASLIRSPNEPRKDSLWSHPEIRNWISFTSEQSYEKKVVLIVGLASKDPHSPFQPFLRPLTDRNPIAGHFHAAVFPYRPLSKSLHPLRDVLHELFQHNAPIQVLHLLADDRPIEGIGETELMRGRCWCAPAIHSNTAIPRIPDDQAAQRNESR